MGQGLQGPNGCECRCLAEDKEYQVDPGLPPEKSNLDFIDDGAWRNIQQPDYGIINQQPAAGGPEVFGKMAQTPLSAPGRENSARSEDSTDGKTASDWAAEQEQFAHLPPLPQGWLRVLSRSTGKIYFCNTDTGETTFTEPTGPSQGDLPPGWTEMVSRSTGRTYYWHAGLQKSMFDKPTLADSDPMGLPPPTVLQGKDGSLPDGWVEVESRSTGKTYFFNQVTQESQFERPV